MTEPERKVLEEISRLAGGLSEAAVRDLAGRVGTLAAVPSVAEESVLLGAVAHGSARDAVAGMLRDWRKQAAGLTPATVAGALVAAGSAHEDWRRRQHLELVWTGPAPTHSTLRHTEQVLVELVKAARDRLLLVTYAAWHHPPLARALEEAVTRGVRITILVDSTDPKAAGPKVNLAWSLGPRVAAAAQVCEWARDRHQPDEDGHTGVLHVKCAVADGREALVSSANLTGHAMDLNMEMGLRVVGGAIAGQIERHFRDLIEAGVFLARPAGVNSTVQDDAP